MRELIEEGRYLTPEELEQYRQKHPEQMQMETAAAPGIESLAPVLGSAEFQTDYNALKEAHRGDIVLYQMGDFFEMFGPDARVASHELNLMLTTRNLPDIGRVAMCGIPGHRLGEYVHRLRDRHDVTVSSIEPDGKRLIVSYPSVEHEAMNARETETPIPEQSAPVHVPGAVPPIPAPAPARDATQEDIDAALRNWNGDMDSRQRVQQYITDHAREKDTAAWLRTEYGGDLPAFPVQLPGVDQDLPWPKVQRRIAQLVQKGQFLSQPDRAADAPAVGQDAPAPTVREIYEKYKPIVKNLVLTDAAYQNACKNSDRESAIMEGDAAVKRTALTITEPEFMRLYHDMPDSRYRLHREIVDETYAVLTQPQQEQTVPPDLSDRPVTREGDTITIGSGDAAHEVDITVSDEEWQTIQEVIGAADQPPHDPLAPAYNPGDTVYLNNTLTIDVSLIHLRRFSGINT